MANVLQCEICFIEFSSIKKLSKHWRREHPNIETLKCCFCKYFTQEYVLFSMHKDNLHAEDRFACEYCDYTSRKWRKIKKHHIKMHLTTEETVSSSELHSTSLKELENVVHLEVTDEPVKKLSKQKSKIPAVEAFVCDVCQMVCYSSSHMSSHQVVHTPTQNYICSNCNRIFSSASIYDKHIKTHYRPKPFKCVKCGNFYTRLECLNKHMRTHNLRQIYTCDLCDFKSISDMIFAAHCRTHLITKPKEFDYSDASKTSVTNHEKTHPSECDQVQSKMQSCGCNGFKNCNICRVIDAEQEKTNQNGSDIFACDVCHKMFKSTEHLSMHHLVHTPLKCYICCMCNRGYNNDIDYDAHIRTHFKYRPFECEMCEKSYTTSWCLKVHMMKHTGDFYYKCDKCDFSSNTRSSFAEHKKRQHSSTKPFKCDVCDYAAVGRSSLTRHLITHTGEKPYYCNQCEYRCNKLGNLNKHKKHMHCM